MDDAVNDLRAAIEEEVKKNNVTRTYSSVSHQGKLIQFWSFQMQERPSSDTQGDELRTNLYASCVEGTCWQACVITRRQWLYFAQLQAQQVHWKHLSKRNHPHLCLCSFLNFTMVGIHGHFQPQTPWRWHPCAPWLELSTLTCTPSLTFCAK